MNFKAASRQITNDFCDAYYAKYMKAQWGIVVGFRTVNERIALMRKQLADWQESYDCTDELCARSKQYVCPPGYVLLPIVAASPSAAVSASASAISLSGSLSTSILSNIQAAISTCAIPACSACQQVEPALPVIVTAYAQLGTPCVLNPPLSARGKHGWQWNGLHSRETIINTFTR